MPISRKAIRQGLAEDIGDRQDDEQCEKQDRDRDQHVTDEGAFGLVRRNRHGGDLKRGCA